MFTLTRSFRSRLATAVSLLALAASCAQASPGVNLAWNHCLGEGTGVQNLAFACNTNSGTTSLVGSCVLSGNYTEVTGFYAELRVVAASARLPDWWRFRIGGCRPTAMSAYLYPDAEGATCADWSAQQAYGGYAYCSFDTYCPDPPNLARLTVASTVVAASAATLLAGREYFAFLLEINHVKTVGGGSCAGCDVPVCIVLDSIEWDKADGSHPEKLMSPTVAGSNVVTWQGGRGTGGVAPCPAVVGTRPSTWGALKALYH